MSVYMDPTALCTHVAAMVWPSGGAIVPLPGPYGDVAEELLSPAHASPGHHTNARAQLFLASTFPYMMHHVNHSLVSVGVPNI